MPTITDPTSYPEYTIPGNAFDPFSNVTITPDFLGEWLTISVNLTADLYEPNAGLGTISDPKVSSIPPSANFTETIQVADLSDATTLLQRLKYTPPSPASGQSSEIAASIKVTNTSVPTLSATDNLPVIDTVTPPSITGTVANEPVSAPLSTTGSIHPFATVSITDTDFSYTANDTARIVVTSEGKPFDADGLLQGKGLSEVGTGVYELSNPVSPYSLASELQNLTLYVPGFIGIRTVNFELDVTDVPPSGATAAPGFDPTTALTSKDTKTSVREYGTPITASVSGKAQEGQTLTATSNDPNATFQWQRSADGITWSNIGGATGNNYAVTEADENDALRVLATDIEQTNPSAATANVVDVTPILSVKVTGIAEVGEACSPRPIC